MSTRTESVQMVAKRLRLRAVLVGLCLLVATFSAERLLFESLFPRFTQLGTPLTATAIALTTAALMFLALRRAPSLPFLALLLNLWWLRDPSVDLVRGGLIFGTTAWLTTALILWHTKQRWRVWLILLMAYLVPIYLATLGRDVGTADTFEFQVTAPQLGIAHPTGYPLYLLLGKLWTLLPFGRTPAMRLNVGTMVYALIAVAIVGFLLYQLFNQTAPAALLAAMLGLQPTFWSQAIAAEVYSLHAVFVTATFSVLCALLVAEGKPQTALAAKNSADQRLTWLALLLGCGMANHVTTILLAPAVAVALLFKRFWKWPRRTFVKMGIAAAAPLLLYLYLPIRWLAVNGEPMGGVRFVGWITGTRFAGALVWRAWIDDPTRWGIIGRIYHQEFGTIGILLAAAGLIALFAHNRRFATVTVFAWLAFSFYALNYYVPDLNVFMLPAMIVMAIWWSALPLFLLSRDRLQHPMHRPAISLLLILMIGVATLRAVATYKQVDASAPNELMTWARAVLDRPLAQNAAILADSDKFPPLYYLQQAEGVRPDLDIMVLPDEAAYRDEINSRFGRQTIYLARYLPKLPYAMRSEGPLVELLPQRSRDAGQQWLAEFGALRLVDAQLAPNYVDNLTAVTLRWQPTEPLGAQQVYFRWKSVIYADKAQPGVHPVNAYYPTAAWQPGEVVTDFHLLAPPRLLVGFPLSLEVAVAPPFTNSRTLEWVTIGRISAEASQYPHLTPLRIWNDTAIIDGAFIPASARPSSEGAAWINGTHPSAATLTLETADATRLSQGGGIPEYESMGTGTADKPYSWLNRIFMPDAVGQLKVLLVGHGSLHCGWLSRPQAACEIGTIDVAGVPLPDGATNYNDQIALVDIDVVSAELIPNSLFDLTLTWQSLASQPEDYTVFVQILDQNDQIVGQVDSWPVQGTYPTTQWKTGETITDPYRIQLKPELASGNYRLIVGLYNLRDLQRLPVLDANGSPIDDKTIVPNLYVP